MGKGSTSRFWLVARHRLRVVEAALALAGAVLAMRILPFRVVAGRVGRVEPGGAPAGATAHFAAPAIPAVRTAVASAVRHLGLRNCCLIMALAAGFMLRRRGVPSVLHLGVARSATGFEGHAWLEAEGRMVCGGHTAAAFTPIARLVSAGTLPP